MRIKSPFRDYYDGVAYSESPLYLRKTEIYGTRTGLDDLIRFKILSPYYEKGVLYFCGTPYRFIRLTERGENKSHTFYNAASMEKYLSGTPFYKEWKKESNQRYTPQSLLWNMKKLRGKLIDGVEITGLLQYELYAYLHRISRGTYDVLEDKLTNHKIYNKDNQDLIPTLLPVLQNTPAVVVKGGELILNPQLSSYEFAKIKDPQTTYQSIEMFLSNIAHPNKPIPAISDRDMRDAKGFDKWSFRKESLKK